MEEKNQRQGRNSSSTFKIGAISLVFLVIGYQTALFINRAAILRIEAARDKPDTVYITTYVNASEAAAEDKSGERAEAGAAGRSGSRTAGRSTSTSPGAAPRTDTLRRNAAHTERVATVRKATRRVESFRFDPNTAGVEEFVRLGFSEKQARAIDNYRIKGGKFRRKEDFAKSFVVSDSIFRRLEPFIDIPKTDINKADSAAFDALPGIGPYFAARMVEFRDRLKGYSHTGQLLDIYNFGEERYGKLEDLIICSEPEPYGLWTLPEQDLRTHPYIGNFQTAKGIVLYRENQPKDSLSVEGLARAGVLRQEDADRLARCRIAAP